MKNQPYAFLLSGCLAGIVLAALGCPGLLRAAVPAAQTLTSKDDVFQGLSASDWGSIRQQYERHRHAAVPVEGGHQERNPGQLWLTGFDGRGFTTSLTFTEGGNIGQELTILFSQPLSDQPRYQISLKNSLLRTEGL
jgi:hypothetical protein